MTKEEFPRTDLSKTCDDVFERETPSPNNDPYEHLIDTVIIFMISTSDLEHLTALTNCI